jgi:hypothetical protein
MEPTVRNVPHPTLDQEMAAFRTAGFTDVTIYSSRPTKVCRSECHAGARKKRPNCRQWPVLRYANITECLTPRAISLRGLPEREFGPALQEYERITGLLGNNISAPMVETWACASSVPRARPSLFPRWTEKTAYGSVQFTMAQHRGLRANGTLKGLSGFPLLVIPTSVGNETVYWDRHA